MAKRKKATPDVETPSRAPRAALINLGCAKNTVDSEGALGELLEIGFDLAVKPEEADLVLINTCGFIESARDESCQVIEEALALKDEEGYPRVVAMGCLSQRMSGMLEERFPGLDGIFGLNAYGSLAKLCQRVLGESVGVCGVGDPRRRSMQQSSRLLLTDPSYAYLRVADGCDNCCSYCAIPQIRGGLQSRGVNAVVEEAQMLSQEMGVRELVLVGQDTTSFGKDRHGKGRLVGLLKRLLKETDVPRLRVLYAHPAYLDKESVALLQQEDRLCHYLDLPLQHVNDAILKRMGRGYDRSRIMELLDALEGLVLRTSLITGFPGETEDAFREMLAFVEEGHFQHLGVFGYSPEPDTPAAGMKEMVPPPVVQERLETLLAAQQQVAFAWQESRLGSTVDILIDAQESPGTWIGRSTAEAPEVDPVIRLDGTNFDIGGIFPACLDIREAYDVRASIASPA